MSLLRFLLVAPLAGAAFSSTILIPDLTYDSPLEVSLDSSLTPFAFDILVDGPGGRKKFTVRAWNALTSVAVIGDAVLISGQHDYGVVYLNVLHYNKDECFTPCKVQDATITGELRAPAPGGGDFFAFDTFVRFVGYGRSPDLLVLNIGQAWPGGDFVIYGYPTTFPFVGVPEPGTLLMAGFGITLIALARGSRRPA